MPNVVRAGLAALGLVWTTAAAQAASVVDTGAGSPTAVGAAIAAQSSSFGQFTLTQDTLIDSIEFFGLVATGGNAAFLLYFNAPGGNTPGFSRGFFTQRLAATPIGGAAAWHGTFGLVDSSSSGDTGIRLEAGTWWVGLASDGLFNARQYGDAPAPLFNEAITNPINAAYVDADNLNLSWRISGRLVAAPPAPAVPEPATWAMLIVGFGAAGGALRRREAVAGLALA